MRYKQEAAVGAQRTLDWSHDVQKTGHKRLLLCHSKKFRVNETPLQQSDFAMYSYIHLYNIRCCIENVFYTIFPFWKKDVITDIQRKMSSNRKRLLKVLNTEISAKIRVVFFMFFTIFLFLVNYFKVLCF